MANIVALYIGPFLKQAEKIFRHFQRCTCACRNRNCVVTVESLESERHYRNGCRNAKMGVIVKIPKKLLSANILVKECNILTIFTENEIG